MNRYITVRARGALLVVGLTARGVALVSALAAPVMLVLGDAPGARHFARVAVALAAAWVTCSAARLGLRWAARRRWRR